MWFLMRMYPEAYYWACTADEDTAQLILQAYNSDEIALDTAKQLWWEIVDQIMDPASRASARRDRLQLVSLCDRV